MIANVVLAGFGNGTVSGSIAYVVTRGYEIAEGFEGYLSAASVSLSASLTAELSIESTLNASATLEPI